MGGRRILSAKKSVRLMVKKKILLLDSDRDFLRDMTGKLEEQGHRVVAAADVLACLDELVEFVPDVACIDLFMPRIGGDDFCRIIRNIDYLQQCRLVLIASSAGGEGLDLQALGVNVCIPRGTVSEMAVRLLDVINASDQRLQVPVQAKPPAGELLRVRQETRELLARNKALRLILESMSQGIIELFDGRIVYANPQALVFLGLSPGKVLGRSVAAVFPGQLCLQIAPLLSGHRSNRREEDQYLPVWLHDRHLLVNRLPVKGEAGSQILLLTDVTEIRRMESVVEAANLMDKLGAVFSGIRHEIGNPVNSIKVALSVLQLNSSSAAVGLVEHFVGPDLEADQHVGAETVAQSNIGGVPSARHQYPANTAHIVARVKDIPMPVEVGFEPGCEIPHTHRHTDVRLMAGAVAGGDVHGTAEGDRQMRIVAAYADSPVEYFQRGTG